MKGEGSTIQKGLWSVLYVTVIAALLLALLGAAAGGANAQGGGERERVGEAPEVDPDPVVRSRIVSPDGATVQTALELPITADTYIASNAPDTNYGSSTWLRLGYSVSSGLGAVRVLLKSDLSRIPDDAEIDRARFRIYQHTVTVGPNDPSAFVSRHLNDDWNEYNVTWNSHQPNWGGEIATSDPSRSIGWIELDVTELIREIYEGVHPSHGVTLLANEEPLERERIFYSREAGNGLYPRIIIDYTERVDNEDPEVTVKPLPEWSRSRFTVEWEGDDPGGSGIDYYDVQYRIPGESWTDWLDNTESTSAEWAGGANGTRYEFRARGVDNAGNIQPFPGSPQAWTRVDAIPPSATVNPLDPVTFSSSFIFSWTGSDNAGGSGVKHYDVQYRYNGAPWEDLFGETPATAAEVTGGRHNDTFEFRVRAVDEAGNVQPLSAVAQASTIVDIYPPTATILPFVPTITAADSFTVRWSGQSSANTSLTTYDVQYRYGGGSWTTWRSQTTEVQGSFTDLRAEDGVYCFQARARDSAGRLGAYSPAQCIIVDRNAPFVEPRVYMPMLARGDGN